MIKPPKLPTQLLERFCPPQLLESIEGDLNEQFYIDVRKHGPSKAKREYVLNVVRFFRPEILLRNRFTVKQVNTIMVGNYFKVAVRNIQKRKLYSFINAFGLSIGIAFCMLIWLFIQDELSFDQFHANKTDIYRIESIMYPYWVPGDKPMVREAWLQLGLLPVIKEECPEVVAGTRYSNGNVVVTSNDKIFKEKIHYVDPDFLTMFSFPLVEGNAKSALSDKFNLVITPDVAEKYFGNEDPIGKTMQLDIRGNKSFVITGVIEAPPANSSLDFQILLRQENRYNYDVQMARWGNFNTPCFVQLRSDADTAVFRRNLAAVSDKHLASMLADWRKDISVPAGINLFEFAFTGLIDIHLMNSIEWHKVSDKQYSYIFGGIALLILLIASINYISLALTTSAGRRTEVGIRKVVGAIRRQLLYQFTIESVVLALIALVVGFTLVALFLPKFNSLTGKQILLSNANLFQFGLFGLALAVVVGLIAGSYPSIFLARFKPALVLKGGFTTRLQAGFTQPLVVLQFSMSAFLIVSSVVMYRQMKFINTKDLGYNQHAVVVVPLQSSQARDNKTNYARFRTAIENFPEISDVGATSIAFNDGYNQHGYKIDGVNKSAHIFSVDVNYIPTLDIQLVSGRNFDPAIITDSTAVIVNEALVKDLGWTSVDDDTYLNWKEDTTSRGARVIGVVKDHNFRSLESPVEPMILCMDFRYAGSIENALIRVSSSDMPSVVSKIETTWRHLFPDKPFVYTFLDENVAKQYSKYENRMSVMGLSTLFAILISCLGLFGLAGINAVNRTKEIGIRKVMGADLPGIFILMNKQYVFLSLIAFALAIPFSWYVMNQWLSGFEFRVQIGWELFAVSILAGLAVALATVSYHAIRVSLINPAETLKYE